MLKKISQITGKGIDYSIITSVGITNNLRVLRDNKDCPKNDPGGSSKLPDNELAGWCLEVADLTFPQSVQSIRALGSRHPQQLSKELASKFRLFASQIQLYSQGCSHV